MNYASTATPSVVNSSETSVMLLAPNPNRQGVWVWNNSTAALYIDFGPASVTNSPLKLQPDAYFEFPTTPIYLGQITGIWESANGKARIVELT